MSNIVPALLGAILGVLIVSGVSFKMKPTIYSSARRGCNLENETVPEKVVTKEESKS